MLLGSIGAIVHGACSPLLWLMFGHLTDLFSEVLHVDFDQIEIYSIYIARRRIILYLFVFLSGFHSNSYWFDYFCCCLFANNILDKVCRKTNTSNTIGNISIVDSSQRYFVFRFEFTWSIDDNHDRV